MSGNLGKNSAVGLRTRITKSSDTAWESGHRAAAPWLLACAYTGYSSSALTIVFAALTIAGVFSGVGAMIVPALGFTAVITILAIATVIAHRTGKDAIRK
ncbi:SdpI family protein [Nocardiopsis ganjiahuensis]|uniref:SdpI family protein n=1 Tax=Nocardiopsis ganjiahuensis TaxID=239984 RepID=UPI001360B222|nr:SdpI family protein [Nocardiopsis ganjiahuensis]